MTYNFQKISVLLTVKENAEIMLNDKPTQLNVDSIVTIQTGSHGYGLSMPGSDSDWFSVYVEPIRMIMKLNEHDHHTRQVKQSNNIDLTEMSLRRAMQQFANCSPTILPVLWMPADSSPEWNLIVEHRDWFIQPKIAIAFRSFAENCWKIRSKLDGGKVHVLAIRTLHVGLNLIRHKEMVLPLAGPMQDFLLGIRRGEVSGAEIELTYELLSKEIEQYIDVPWQISPQDHADRVADLSAQVHKMHWGLTSPSAPLLLGYD